MNNVKTYYKGSDILIPITLLGKDGQVLPPSSLISYRFELVGEDSSSRFPGLIFSSNPTEGELLVNIVSDEDGKISLLVPKSFTTEARTGDYYINPLLVLNTSADPSYGVDEFNDKSGSSLAFKLEEL